MRKPRVFWDLDDSLNNLMEAWLKRVWNKAHPQSEVDYPDLRENPPTKILGCSLSEYLNSLDHFRNSRAAKDLVPNPAILSWFRQHGSGFEHHVVTARPAETASSAAEWVFRHFGEWIAHFHRLPPQRVRPRNSNCALLKGPFIQSIGGGEVMLDDSEQQLASAEGIVKERILIPQPWNGGGSRLEVSLARILSL